MGKTYSLNGYLNAALRRSGRTLLVEGPSDKHVLHKFELEQFPQKAGASVIDHAGMLDDLQLSGLGNRAKILAVRAQVSTLAVSVPKIAAVLATITDREWDGLNFVASVPHPTWSAPPQNPGHFITLGHSIENYHFDADFATEYLKYAFAEHISAHILTTVTNLFPAIITLATVFSLKIRDAGCIGRCGGLMAPEFILVKDGRVYLELEFGSVCAARQIASAATIVGDTNSAVDVAWAALTTSEFARWLPHGHIGEEVLWCAIAKVALLGGVPTTVSNEIAHGYKKDRERFSAQWLSKLSTPRQEPLNKAIEWLHG